MADRSLRYKKYIVQINSIKTEKYMLIVINITILNKSQVFFAKYTLYCNKKAHTVLT